VNAKSQYRKINNGDKFSRQKINNVHPQPKISWNRCQLEQGVKTAGICGTGSDRPANSSAAEPSLPALRPTRRPSWNIPT